MASEKEFGYPSRKAWSISWTKGKNSKGKTMFGVYDTKDKADAERKLKELHDAGYTDAIMYECWI